MTTDEIELVHISVCTHFMTEEEKTEDINEDIKTVFEHKDTIDVSEELPNRKEEINLQNIQDAEYVYSNGPLEMPSPGEHNAISINIDDELDVHIHSHSSMEDRVKILRYHEEFSSVFEEIHITHLRIHAKINKSVGKLNIPTNSLGEMEISGIEFESDNNWFGIRSSDDSDYVRATFQYRGKGEYIEPSGLVDIAENKINKAEDVLHDLIDEPT